MNIEEAKANIGKEVVLLPETKPYFGAVKYSDFDYESLERKDKLIIGDTTISGLVVIDGRAILPQHIELKEVKEKEMKEYKIRVANEDESKEVQGLLFELGYKWNTGGKEYTFLKLPFLSTWESGTIKCGVHEQSFIELKQQEITLPQLRDLAVLHRNDENDATHILDDGKYYIGNKVYFWDEEKWVNCSTSVQYALTKCTPIQKGKEITSMTWQDALRAVLEGKEVEMEWADSWYKVETVRVNNIKKGKSFRLAPQRKELNGNFTKEELLKIAGEME